MKRMIKYKNRHNFQKKIYYKYRNNAKKIRKRILVPKTPHNTSQYLIENNSSPFYEDNDEFFQFSSIIFGPSEISDDLYSQNKISTFSTQEQSFDINI